MLAEKRMPRNQQKGGTILLRPGVGQVGDKGQLEVKRRENSGHSQKSATEKFDHQDRGRPQGWGQATTVISNRARFQGILVKDFSEKKRFVFHPY